MTLLQLYEKVTLIYPIDQRRFFSFFNDTVNELVGLHGEVSKLLFQGNYTADAVIPVKALTDEIVVLPLYHNAILDNILFYAGQGDAYKGEFIRKSKDAYLKYWNDNAKGKRIKRGGW